MKVVCNTSPLILLAKIHRLELLVRLYDGVMAPVTVWQELTGKPGPEVADIQDLRDAQGLKLQRPKQHMLQTVPVELGPGEREVIALGLEIAADLVVLDDQEGRRLARARGLAVTGTIGILVEARQQGLISSLRRELDHLVEAGMWMSEEFYYRLVEEFGE